MTKLTDHQIDLLSAIARGDVYQQAPIGAGPHRAIRESPGAPHRTVTGALKALKGLAYAETDYRGDGRWRLTAKGRQTLWSMVDDGPTLAALIADEEMRQRLHRAAQVLEENLAQFHEAIARLQEGDLGNRTALAVREAKQALATATKALFKEAGR